MSETRWVFFRRFEETDETRRLHKAALTELNVSEGLVMENYKRTRIS